jgi:hypothetical protein
MITISQSLEQSIATTPYLEEALSKGLINLSALARSLKPGLQKKLYKRNISEASLVMALKRLEPKLRKKIANSRFSLKADNITVRSNIIEITLQNSPEVDIIRKAIAKLTLSDRDAFFSLIQGVRESTFVVSRNLASIIEKYGANKIIEKIDNLSSISIFLPPENRKQPGIYYTLLKILAWHNINLVEVISNYNELTLVFENGVVDQAFSLLKSLSV